MLPAQLSRTLFAWSGRVDREVLLVMYRGGVETRFSGGSDDDRGRVRVNDPLPRTDGYVDVRLTRGRGSADVLQRPSARNDYTAVLRVEDRQGGAGCYDFEASWYQARRRAGRLRRDACRMKMR